MGGVPCCRDLCGRFGTADTPPMSDPVSKFADSKIFVALGFITVLLNIAFRTYIADKHINEYDTMSSPSDFVFHGEVFFLCVYAFEFLVNFWRVGWSFFYNRNWKNSWVDVLILISSASTVVLLATYSGASDSHGLRILRLLSLLKVISVYRVACQVKPLRILLNALVGTLGTLLWSLVMLSLIIYLFSLLMVTRVANYMRDEGASLDPQLEESLLNAYGGVWLTCRNLFFLSFAGQDWDSFLVPLYSTGSINPFLFASYAAFTQLAVWNVILGVFVDAAMKSVTDEKDSLLQEDTERELLELCHEADLDKDGKLSTEEWRLAVSHGAMMTDYLETMGFRESDVRDFLSVMCRSAPDGAIDIDEFVRGCVRFKGPASCFDMQIVLSAVGDLKNRVGHAASEGTRREAD